MSSPHVARDNRMPRIGEAPYEPLIDGSTLLHASIGVALPTRY